jgi:hypothetical protein
MAMFQHPHLTRGVVRTPKGAFVITRGLVSAPDDIGDALGWRRVDDESDVPSIPAASLRRRDRLAAVDGVLLDRQ